MKLVDTLAQKLALRWLRGKAGRARQGGPMRGVIRLLDGWKSWIVAMVLTVCEVVRQAGGPDITTTACRVMGALGWPCADLAFNPVLIGGALFALWALGGRLWLAIKQARAGATPTELLSAEGYIKEARAESRL